MSQRSLTPSSPGGRSPSPTPYYYGKVYRIANDVDIGEFIDGNLWKYRKKGSGSLSPSFDEFDGVKTADAGVQVELSPGPFLTKVAIYELDSPQKALAALSDKNNNRETMTLLKSHNHANGSAPGAENGSYGGVPGSPTYASASFMTNVHRLHCKVCKAPEKCSKNPTMKLACPIRQCSDPKCEAQFHACLQEQHVNAKRGGACSAIHGDAVDSGTSAGKREGSSPPGPKPKTKPTPLTLASLRAAHYQAYAAKHESRLPWPVFTVSRDAEPSSEGGKRVYGGTFYSNRFRASREVYICEIGFHGPADASQAKYTVFVEIFEPQAPEPPVKPLSKSKSKSKYRLQVPLSSIPVHVYPKGLLRERICRRRWSDVEAARGEIFYVDLLEDDIVRAGPPVRIQAGVWYLIQFCIEGPEATRNCSRTLEQVKVTLVGETGGDVDNEVQFSFNVGSMQMPELRFVVPAAANSTSTSTSSRQLPDAQSKAQPSSSKSFK